MNGFRTLSFVLAPLVALCVVPPETATAAEPNIFERHFERSGVFTTCATFDVTFVGNIDARYIVSYGEDGQATREIRHVSFTGTLTGPAESLPYSGHFTRTEDLTARTARFTGVHLMVTRPDGPPLLAAGIDAFSLDSADDDRATGRLPQAFYTDVCAEFAQQA
jgi:hypothetical protein